MSRPGALIFDFDGTIIDTEWPAFVTVRDIYRDHDLDFTIEDWESRIGRADSAHWTESLGRALGTSLDPDEYDRRRRPVKNDLTEKQPLRRGIERLLLAGGQSGVPMAVASSSPYSWVGGHIDRRGLRPHFEAICTVDDVANGKPWPDVFLFAAEAVQVPADEAVVIEDSRNGLLAAKAAGMRCVVVPNEITRNQDFAEADLVLGCLSELSLELFDL
jgi:HAD superfamily hydrolase (TIGR01509 family)